MDISINSRHPSVTDPATLQGASPAEAAKEKDKPALVVTEARADALADTGATERVSEDALRRDDALGKLFSAVFTLPAPPMPVFPQ